MSRDKIVVLDFGSQYAHLIAKRFRLLGYYSEIALPSAPLSVFEDTKGIVFSGGPSSVYEKDVPQFNQEILSLDIPPYCFIWIGSVVIKFPLIFLITDIL